MDFFSDDPVFSYGNFPGTTKTFLGEGEDGLCFASSM
jgi:hypothetical protein